MAVIGTLGNTVFAVSNEQVKTVQNLVWTSTANYAKHQLHGQTARLEFTGLEPDKISLDVKLSRAFGTDPLNDIIELLRVERAGESNYLVIGEKIYGKDRWVIESSERTVTVFDGRGNMAEVMYRLNLLAYE